MSRTMETNAKPFHERVAALKKQGNLRGRKGERVLYEMRPDGLLVPVTTGTQDSPFPWRSLIVTALFLLGVKTFMFAHFGSDQLNDRAMAFEGNHALGQAASIFLHEDPVTQWLALQTRDLLGK